MFRREHQPSVGARGHLVRLIGLALTFLLIIANGVVGFSVLFDLRDADARVERAVQAILVLKQIDDLVVESGRSQRLYRVFGNPHRLAAYREAQTQLPGKLESLRGLIADNPDQSARLAELRMLIERDGAELAETLDPVEAGIAPARQPQDLAAGVARSEEIVSCVNVMLESEQQTLYADLTATDLRDTMTLGTVILGGIGSMVLIGVLFVMMRRDTRQSEELAQAHSGALQESEQRFRRIFEESPLGIVLAQHDTQRIIQANPAFCRMLGYDVEQIVGQGIADLAHIDDRNLMRDAIRQSSTPDHGVEIRCVTRLGVVAWVRVRLTQLSGVNGSRGFLLVLAEDITREKRVEAELRQAQKMEAVGQLTGGIAHDFNNLLGVIIGNAEFLMEATQDRHDDSGLVQEILNSALSGADLTRRLLAFARRQTLQPRQIDLNAYLPNHVGILRRLLGETVQITTELAANLWATRADPSQVGDALLNLAINARDAMPHGGQVAIETANTSVIGLQDAEITPGDYVVLSVTDTGTGMPPEVLERVVEPFFTTKGPGVGSGLGLSMIFGFAKQSGGHLRIESELGRGTTVRLYLPRAQFVEADAAAGLDISLPGGKEAVLLVDDNLEMRTVARRHLASLGYLVSEAESGPAALEIMQAGARFDLLFTDIVMPEGMTGYQLAAAARQLQPGLKVLFTTGYVRAGAGQDDCEPQPGAMIRKPYRKQELATTLRATLEA
jgi:PAS domain S-box-containing protein